MTNETNAVAISNKFAVSKDDKVKIFNALNNPDFSIGDCIGVEVNVKHWFIIPTEFVDKETGETVSLDRSIIISDTGETYTAISKGFANAIRNYNALFETGHSPENLRIKFCEEGTGIRKYYTFSVIA